MNIITKKFDLGDGRMVEIETGKLAKQADGAAVVRMNDTMLLATVCSKREVGENVDFMPLTVDYQEKYAAMGRFPGGFFKREQRPLPFGTFCTTYTHPPAYCEAARLGFSDCLIQKRIWYYRIEHTSIQQHFTGFSHQFSQRERITVTSHRTTSFGAFQAVLEVWRITYYRIVLRITGHLPEIRPGYPHAVAERTLAHVARSLFGSLVRNVYPRHLGIRKPLCHHQGNKSGTCTNIQYFPTAFSPSPKKHAISPDLHRSLILRYFKLSKSEWPAHSR